MAVPLSMRGAQCVVREARRLAAAEEGVYFLHAAPLNLGGAEGSPCRATLVSFDEKE